ncbi:signal peptide peptidase SppA [Planctomycetota bacterium]|nr:signal peptide peptidase SppA [Planctomycetota bacterium]
MFSVNTANVYAQDSETDEGATSDIQYLVGWLELSGSLRSGPIPFAWMSEDELGPSLESIVNQLRTVRDDVRYKGLVLFMNYPSLSYTEIQTLAKELNEVKNAGKRIVAFGEMYNTMGYMLASNADIICLQHKGELDFSSVSVEEMYLAGLLEKVGAKAELIQVGQYKGANETLTRKQPSDAWSQNIDGLLDDLHSQIVKHVSFGRNISIDKIENLIGRTWTMTDEELVEAGLIDKLVKRDLISVTEVEFGEDFQWDKDMGHENQGGGLGSGNNPLAIFQLLFQQKPNITQRDTIAVVHCMGPIHSGRSSRSDGMFSEDQIGSKTVTKTLARLKADEYIKGVILRIDSPGGSALASEMMWQSIRELGEKKPVYVSIGGMAASGGYYMACAGDEIFVSPSSVVGSIGVVGGKIVLGDLYNKIGVQVTRRSRGNFGDLFNSVEPFNQEQRKLVKQSMTNVYVQFKDRVAKGRGSRLIDINQVDEGMLFTGKQAVKNGMADQIGNLNETIDAIVSDLSLADDSFDIKHYPEPMSLPEFINSNFNVQSKSINVQKQLIAQSVKSVLGERAWRSVSNVLDGIMILQHEPTLTLLPVGIVIK